jgi:hypothetical protein
MPRFGTYLLSAASLLVVFGITTCGSSNRQLESITISSGGNVSMQYTATGRYNESPTSVTSLPVSWYVVVNTAVNPAITGPPVYGYTLTTQPFELSPCVQSDTVVALAPADPNAPTTGEVSLNVYQDLIITHAVSKEGGFVAAAAPANCSL